MAKKIGFKEQHEGAREAKGKGAKWKTTLTEEVVCGGTNFVCTASFLYRDIDE